MRIILYFHLRFNSIGEERWRRWASEIDGDWVNLTLSLDVAIEIDPKMSISREMAWVRVNSWRCGAYRRSCAVWTMTEKLYCWIETVCRSECFDLQWVGVVDRRGRKNTKKFSELFGAHAAIFFVLFSFKQNFSEFVCDQFLLWTFVSEQINYFERSIEAPTKKLQKRKKERKERIVRQTKTYWAWTKTIGMIGEMCENIRWVWVHNTKINSNRLPMNW